MAEKKVFTKVLSQDEVYQGLPLMWHHYLLSDDTYYATMRVWEWCEIPEVMLFARETGLVVYKKWDTLEEAKEVLAKWMKCKIEIGKKHAPL
jgi:hypothetical protein